MYYTRFIQTCLALLWLFQWGNTHAQTNRGYGLLAGSLDGRLRLSAGAPAVFDFQAQGGRFVANHVAVGFNLQLARPQTITRIEQNVTELGQGVFARYYIPNEKRPDIRLFFPLEATFFQRRGRYFDIQGNTISTTPSSYTTRRRVFSSGLGAAWFVSETWAIESKLLYTLEGFRRTDTPDYQYASLLMLRMGVTAFIRPSSKTSP